MMIFALAGTLIGAILGINFSVLALIPAMACALVIALATSLLGGGVSVACLVCLLAGSQVGYVAAAGLRFALQRAAIRASVGRQLAGRVPPQNQAR
jgi:hypothetical protein